MKKKEPDIRKVILGIDPGTNILGYSVIEINKQEMKLIEINVLHMDKAPDHYQKLKEIFDGIRKVVRKYKPTEMAIESPFFGKNVQSMLKLGRAQGVAITVALSEDVPVFEYSPRKIKQSITGNGNASKEQVAAILSHLLKFDHQYLLLDATDALGVAVCHHFQNKSPVSTDKKVSGWKQFLLQNPERAMTKKKS
ncbi:MAG: crossover junction endodeoxyribonuclease RuvC [Chitinophagaceae bacterium]|nr:crossover junction endodeoxyribonuclease RuvC [Chitinophagaceae bacterium]